MNYFNSKAVFLQIFALASLLYCGDAFAMDNMNVDNMDVSDKLTYNPSTESSKDNSSSFNTKHSRSPSDSHNNLSYNKKSKLNLSEVMSEEDYKQLCNNIRKLETTEVQKRLDRGVDLSTTKDKGYAALWYAIQLNDQKLVKQLVKHGAVLENRYEILSTHLIQAIRDQRETMIKCLVECKADLDYSDGYDTPLTELASGFFPVLDDNAMTKYLVEHGANVNKGDKHGNTPLLIAVRGFKTDLVKCLVEHGANVNKMNINGETPLSFTEGKKFELNKRQYLSETIISSEEVDAMNQEIRDYLKAHGAK